MINPRICFKCEEYKTCEHDWGTKESGFLPVCDECKESKRDWFKDNGVILFKSYEAWLDAGSPETYKNFCNENGYDMMTGEKNESTN